MYSMVQENEHSIVLNEAAAEFVADLDSVVHAVNAAVRSLIAGQIAAGVAVELAVGIVVGLAAGLPAGFVGIQEYQCVHWQPWNGSSERLVAPHPAH